MQSSRRQFVLYSVTGVGAMCLGAAAQAQAMVSETDPQAAAVGYKADTTKVDNKKFPKHAATHFIRAQQRRLPQAVPSSPESRSPVRDGAPPGRRRADQGPAV